MRFFTCKNNIMEDIKILTDTPVSKYSEDKFQRYDFAKHIANTIVETTYGEGVVIGIYGAWGEGKTSVLNFIESELANHNGIICIKFNPWRYSDESVLLFSFFNKLSKALKKQLLNKREQVGKFLRSGSSVLGYDIPKVGDISKAINAIGNLLGKYDLEDLKNRLNKTIVDSSKKLVVFIDDIDRLDKNEIYSIFRLIKLSADFSNTTYILSFDEKIVASAIGCRFGSGDDKSGRDFLEKIVQVPLNIPKANSEALQKYCFELINRIFDVHKIEVQDDELKSFGYQFTTNIVSNLETPRMAVRYANSLSFSLPFLNKEVNLSDLLLIEAIKIFYPKHYYFIKQNPNYFISDYKDLIRKSDDDKKEQIKSKFEELGKEYSIHQQKCIFDLLQHLFPYLKEAYDGWDMSSYVVLNLYKNKNIGSPKYFSRYFSYVVSVGDISDVEFNKFMSDLDSFDSQQTADAIILMVKNGSSDSFIFKIRAIEDSIKWECSRKLLYTLPILGYLFPETYEPLSMGFNSPKTQLAILICQLLKNQSNRDDRLAVGKEVLLKTDTLELAHNILSWVNVGNTDEDKLFNESEIKILKGLLVERIVAESGDIPIYSKHTNLYYIFKDWNECDRKKMIEYVKKHIKKNPSEIFLLLRSVMSKNSMNNKILDINKEKFDFINTLFDKEYVNKTILEVVPLRIINQDDIIWTEHSNIELTDIDIARQFRYWYNTEKSKK